MNFSLVTMNRKIPEALVQCLAVPLIGICASACSCPADTRAGLLVLVVGGGSDKVGAQGGNGGDSAVALPCRAHVTVPKSPHPLECNSSGANCSCVGLYDTKGRFDVIAELDGRTETAKVRIKKEDRCHVGTEHICMFGDCPPDWP